MIKFKLKDYLKKHNMTLVKLQKMTGIRYATLHGMYKGDIERLNLNYLDIIMTTLSIENMNILLEKTDG